MHHIPKCIFFIYFQEQVGFNSSYVWINLNSYILLEVIKFYYKETSFRHTFSHFPGNKFFFCVVKNLVQWGQPCAMLGTMS